MRESSDFELTDTENKTDEIREFLWKTSAQESSNFWVK